MAKKDKVLDKRLWDGIVENDFDSTRNLEVVDIGEYDEEKMTLFAANTNLWRQLLRLSDSLKPVERRILYGLYLQKAYPGHKLKSMLITGYTQMYHAHGDSYPSMVGMAQGWKKQVPLIAGKGNFGSASSDLYAADRYTEASMSKYAKECFFDDYDPDCVEMVFNSASDLYEPMSLPSKFPNVLVNGGMGIAFGNAFRIPTYNINDIIDVCKRVIESPETANVFMIPDLPSGCQIVDDGQCFNDIIGTGRGTLKMRATAEIFETSRYWGIKITSVPWMVSLMTIGKRLAELSRQGILPIKDIQDHSYPVVTENGIQSRIDYRIMFDKAHDPYVILNKIYSQTELQKSVAIDFKVVLDDLTVKRLNMRELINAWLDERRSYKRRLFNKRLTKISARIDLLEILIKLCTGENLKKTTDIIQHSHEEEAVNKLRKLAEMTSYQATQIYEMRLRAFNADAKKHYQEELVKLTKERDELMKTIRSEKKIDRIIMDELEDLRKYASPRKSEIVAEETGSIISDTTHSLIISNQGFVKKLTYYKDNPNKNVNMGSFKSGDYPIEQLVVHNSSSVIFLDSFGRFSIVPVHQIDNTETSQYGHTLFTISKLTGKVVQCMEAYDADLIKTMTKKIGVPYLTTITRNGYAKKTEMEIYTGIKNSKNVRAMKIRDDDSLAVADVMFERSQIILYTNQGEYSYMRVKDIPTQAKDSMGLISIRVKENDFVRGYAPVGSDDDFVIVISDKGMIKKIDLRYFGDPAKRGSKNDQSYLMTLDPTDGIRFASGIRIGQKITIAMRNSVVTLAESDIPSLTKKHKGKRMINPSPSANIVAVSIHD
jgi:DNA gyrase subunit A